jgi:putative ABC transport system ATP-binding protein
LDAATVEKALAAVSEQRVVDLLRRLVDAAGQTIVMVTHDPAAAARADAVVFLSDGRIVDQAMRPSAREVADRLARLEG